MQAFGQAAPRRPAEDRPRKGARQKSAQFPHPGLEKFDDPDRFAGRRVGVVICGGNIDARLLSSILLRGLIRGGRLVRLRAEIVDVPGALARIAAVTGKAGANIVDVHHRRLFYDLSVKRAEIDIVLETRDTAHVHAVVDDLKAEGFPSRIMSEVDG